MTSGDLKLPYIPEMITVHLGAPDAAAENITVRFTDYIKNVASSEIFPTWPAPALRANILAIISFALNRVYTNYYRSRGYNFNITNDITRDQSFIAGRDVFENISEIVDEVFDSYIRKKGSVEPYFTQYCNGTTSTCDGLSQWGTVTLANQGLSSVDILKYYYGDDIELVVDVPVEGISDPVPDAVLRYGSVGNEVSDIQSKLNRISKNYPAIPKINPVDGIFGNETEAAVREFQSIFNLTADGLVGRSTWYAIQRIYAAVKRLNDLASEGISPEELTSIFALTLSEGDSGVGVRELQYFLNFISLYNEHIPYIEIDGTFGAETRAAVEAFQSQYGLDITGTVELDTWDALYRAYRGIIESLGDSFFDSTTAPYPGFPLRIGMENESVRELQKYLMLISTVYTEIPSPEVTGVFDAVTRAAVEAFQERVGIPVSGIVAGATWNAIASAYRDIFDGSIASHTQGPSSTLTS